MITILTAIMLTTVAVATLSLVYNQRQLLGGSVRERTEDWYLVKAGVVDGYERLSVDPTIVNLLYNLDVDGIAGGDVWVCIEAEVEPDKWKVKASTKAALPCAA
ncbi:MAG: hypothetical protein ACI9CF_000386 [Candidatus Omnitrophota bacterium]|jgi:hypothetical protein